eukprot:Awhi_evm1s4266
MISLPALVFFSVVFTTGSFASSICASDSNVYVRTPVADWTLLNENGDVYVSDIECQTRQDCRSQFYQHSPTLAQCNTTINRCVVDLSEDGVPRCLITKHSQLIRQAYDELRANPNDSYGPMVDSEENVYNLGAIYQSLLETLPLQYSSSSPLWGVRSQVRNIKAEHLDDMIAIHGGNYYYDKMIAIFDDCIDGLYRILKPWKEGEDGFIARIAGKSIDRVFFEARTFSIANMAGSKSYVNRNKFQLAMEHINVHMSEISQLSSHSRNCVTTALNVADSELGKKAAISSWYSRKMNPLQEALLVVQDKLSLL